MIIIYHSHFSFLLFDVVDVVDVIFVIVDVDVVAVNNIFMGKGL